MFFTSDLSSNVIKQSNQFIAVKFTYSALNLECLAILVHANCEKTVRKLLWTHLGRVLPSVLPSIIIGDFNVILSLTGKSGKKPFRNNEAEDFQDFIQAAEVTIWDSVV